MSDANSSRQRACRAAFHADSGRRVLRTPGDPPPIGERAAKAMMGERLAVAIDAPPAELADQLVVASSSRDR